MKEMETQNKRINIFIADSSTENRKELVEYMKGVQDFNVVGETGDSFQALEYIKNNQTDVLIMDIVLSGMDGFEFIEKAKKEVANLPRIIITSCLTHNGFVDKAISLGANYFMIKPVNTKILETRIREVLNLKQNEHNMKSGKNSSNKILDEKISNIFITVGIPAHIKGYQFLREAIKLTIDKPEIINSITKKLYPSIAEHFSTSASKVERAIRHAIEVAWNRGKIENINNIFGLKVYNQNEKPTNGEFIALVADKMLMEGY